jgi:hypothetical protein
MPSIKCTLLSSALFLFASTSQAATSCSGSISILGISDVGDIYVSLAGVVAIHNVCNINTQYSYAVNPTTCKSMHAMLIGARLGERPVRLYYRDPVASCGSIPAWSGQTTFYHLELY